MVNLVNIREEANRPIPGPEGGGGGGEAHSIPAPRRRTPIPTPRRNVRQLIQYFEDNPIPPYRPIPAPRTKKQQPVTAPRTKIDQKRRVLNPLSPNIHIQILQTDLYTFPLRIS